MMLRVLGFMQQRLSRVVDVAREEFFFSRLVSGHLGEGLVELLADGLELLLLVAELICREWKLSWEKLVHSTHSTGLSFRPGNWGFQLRMTGSKISQGFF